jgi:hypothetical protein
MLDMGNFSSFKYRLRKILEEMEGSEPILSSNIGIDSTKKYIEDIVEHGTLKREKADEIIELLDRFSKYR